MIRAHTLSRSVSVSRPRTTVRLLRANKTQHELTVWHRATVRYFALHGIAQIVIILWRRQCRRQLRRRRRRWWCWRAIVVVVVHCVLVGAAGRSHSNNSLVRHTVLLLLLYLFRFISIYFCLLFLAFRWGELNGNFLILFRWFTGFVFALTTFDVVEYVSVSVWCAVQYTNFHSNRIESNTQFQWRQNILTLSYRCCCCCCPSLFSLVFPEFESGENWERENRCHTANERKLREFCFALYPSVGRRRRIVFSFGFSDRKSNFFFCRIFLSHTELSVCTQTRMWLFV